MTLGEKIHATLSVSAVLDTLGAADRIRPVIGEEEMEIPAIIYAFTGNTDFPTTDDATEQAGQGLDDTTVVLTCLANTRADARLLARTVRNLLRAAQIAGTFAVNLLNGPAETTMGGGTGAPLIHRSDLTFRILHNLSI